MPSSLRRSLLLAVVVATGAGHAAEPAGSGIETAAADVERHDRSSAADCAVCHNLATPFLDAQGRIVGAGLPEQVPFGERLGGSSSDPDSPTAGCLLCHAGRHDERTPVPTPDRLDGPGGADRSAAGANIELLSLMAVETALAGGDPAPLLAAIEAGRDELTRAGDVRLLSSSVADGVLEFTVAIDNATGHKLPTTFPSRRVWLHTVVRDDNGVVVFESGGITSGGRIVGADGDDDPAAYEPHHTTITSSDQVQIYESVLGTSDGSPTTILIRAAGYLKDNRLEPTGSDRSTTSDGVSPVGRCTADPDFVPGGDEITYRITGLAGSDFRVTVELRHQTIAYSHIRDLSALPPEPAVTRFLGLYNTVRPGSELISELVFDADG